MSADIIDLHIQTTATLPAKRVLQAAIDADVEIEDVIVIGWDKAGNHYFASNSGDAAGIILLLELSKKNLLEQKMITRQ